MTNIYIEDTTTVELKRLILTNKDLKFKHLDCCMVFTSDGDNLYAQDIDWKKSPEYPTNDIFQTGDFTQTLYNYYLTFDNVIALLESLEAIGMKLSLSDELNNHSMRLTEFKEQISSKNEWTLK